MKYSDNLVEFKLIADKLIKSSKRIFGKDLYKKWFKSVNIENAMYLRVYYFLLSLHKRSDNYREYDLKSIFNSDQYFLYRLNSNEIMKMFIDRIGSFVVNNKYIEPDKLDQNTSTIIFIIGGNQELPFLQILEKYIEIHHDMKWRNRILKLITNKSKDLPNNVTVLLKKKNKISLNKFDKNFLDKNIDIDSASACTAPKDLYKQHRSRWEILSKTFDSLSGEDRVFAAFALEQLLIVLKISYSISGIFLKYSPIRIFGAFEKSAYGTLLKELSRSKQTFRRCKIINIQHGIITESSALNKTRFDYFLVWDKATHSILKCCGYKYMKNVCIVGNQVWDDLRANNKKNVKNNKIEQLERWKGSRRLILACAQPLEIGRQDWFRNILYSYIESHQNTLLFVRLHPNQHDETKRQWEKTIKNEIVDKIKITLTNSYSLAEIFKYSDLVCSDYSTVLIDAYYANIKALSISKDIIQDSIISNYLSQLNIPIASNMIDSYYWIDRLFDENKAPNDKFFDEFEVFEHLYPKFLARIL